MSGAEPAPRPPDEPFLREYLDHLRAERGLSPNTLEAYGRDLRRLQEEAREQGTALLELEQGDLAEHIRRLGRWAGRRRRCGPGRSGGTHSGGHRL